MTPDDANVRFLLRLGQALHANGYSSDGLENALQSMASRLGVEAQFFTTPTSLFAAFGDLVHQRTHLLRVYPGDVDLGRLSRLDEISREVERGESNVEEGSARIDAVIAAKDQHVVLTVLAYAIASAATCRILGGGLHEVVVAGIAGLLTGALSRATRRLPHGSHVFELVASLLVSALVTAVAAAGVRLSVPTATLGGIITLVPGLTVTIAMIELARRHLAAGTARLLGAFLVFVVIAFGVTVGRELTTSIAGDVRSLTPAQLPGWTLTLALATAPAGFGVLMRARWRDFPWLWVSSAVGYLTVRFAAQSVEPAVAASLGALAVGLLSNCYERLGRGPATVPLVPGVLLLVPGSIGYRSLASLLDQNVLVGVATAVTMILTAVAIAGGLVVSSVLVPTRRS